MKIAPKLKLWLAGLGLISAGGGLAAGAQAQPGHPAVVAAPAAWTAYAVAVSDQLQAWMAEDSAPALKVMTDLVKLQPASEAEQPIRLDVKLWIDPDGGITRLETSAGPGSALDADLAALAQGRRLASPPPAGLAFPIRLRLALKPPAAPSGQAGPVGP